VSGVVVYSLLVSDARSGPPATNAGFNPTREVGAIYPTGYWDPAGLMKRNAADGDGWEWKDEATFRRYRMAELKHGRVCMVALTGMITASFVRFPNEIFEQSLNGLSAAGTEVAGAIGMIFLAAGFIEVEKGDGAFDDPLNWQEKTGGSFGDFVELQNKELAHGRLAMSAVFTLWLFEYGMGREASFFIAESLNPVAVLSILALLLVWVPYTLDKREYRTA